MYGVRDGGGDGDTEDGGGYKEDQVKEGGRQGGGLGSRVVWVVG